MTTLILVDFLITFPLVLLGLVMVPDPLYIKKTWWMTERERKMCMKRLEADDRQPLGNFGLSIFKRVLGRWHFWVLVSIQLFQNRICYDVLISGLQCTWFSLMYFVYQQPTTSTMALWLKAEKTYSVPQINNLPTVYSAVSIVFMLASGVYNDWRDSQIDSVIAICLTQIVSESILVAWSVPKGAKFFAYYVAGTIQSLFPIIVSWTNMVCSRDAEERAIVIGSLNAIGLAQGTWWNQVSPTLLRCLYHFISNFLSSFLLQRSTHPGFTKDIGLASQLLSHCLRGCQLSCGSHAGSGSERLQYSTASPTSTTIRRLIIRRLHR